MAVDNFLSKKSINQQLKKAGVTAAAAKKKKKASKTKGKSTVTNKKGKSTSNTQNSKDNRNGSPGGDSGNNSEITEITVASNESQIEKMMMHTMNGVEGLPYQFLSSVDCRLEGSEIGAKYAEKIISRLPLLFLVPCKQVFMDDYDDSDKSNVLSMLTGAVEPSSDLVSKDGGRYYSVDYDYATYYKYLNCMLSAVAHYMGIYNKTIKINGKKSKLGTFAWQNELSDDFKAYFSSQQNVVFYLDGLNQVSESYSNSTTESSLASTLNSYSDNINEIRFLVGNNSKVMNGLTDAASSVTSVISSALQGISALDGVSGILSGLSKNGVKTVLNGGKIVFPQIWNDSSFDRSYSIDIKLRSPDHDSVSIFLNIIKPYCRLLCLTLPRLMEDDPNGYNSPFLVKAYSKGIFNIDMGIIESMSVTKGAECCWNDDGLPTQIDISLSIRDLYSSLAMSGFDDSIKNITKNTSYMDYLATLSGLNVCRMEITKRIVLYYYLTQSKYSHIPSKIYTAFDNKVSNIISGIFDKI